MTVLKSVRSRKFLAAMSALTAVAATLLGANVASGDEVWNQSYQRASQSEECVAQPGETPWQDSWGTNPGWSPSWAKWANEGQGGWTCNRSITWAQTPVPASSSSGGGGSITYTCSNAGVRSPGGGACVVGDIGPGGGLVFYIDSASGLRYEMAPKAWSGAGTPDAGASYCDTYPNDVSGAAGTAVGTGAANTAAMAASIACSSNAAAAVLAYPGNDSSVGQWFLPSKDELNAMCYYSRNLSASPDPTLSCFGGSGTTQDGTFAGGDYGFASVLYWSSSQATAYNAWSLSLDNGNQFNDGKVTTLRVRPVRAF